MVPLVFPSAELSELLLHKLRLSPTILCLLGKGHQAIAVVTAFVRDVCLRIVVVGVVAPVIPLLLPQSRVLTAPIARRLLPWGLASSDLPLVTMTSINLASPQSQDPPQLDLLSAVVALQSFVGSKAVPNFILVITAAMTTVPCAPSKS
jgi:hypothetical protein